MASIRSPARGARALPINYSFDRFENLGIPVWRPIPASENGRNRGKLSTMSIREPLVRDISDTALLAAIYPARETERPDAVFPRSVRVAPRRRARRPDREIHAFQRTRNVGLDHTHLCVRRIHQAAD